jgi:NAD(P)-dependent dehydrogenase (short-subunit alcohol dehydrogenase family)
MTSNKGREMCKQFDVSGKVGVVTGAGSGIGRALSIGLAAAGMRLVVMGNREAQLLETVKTVQDAGHIAYPIVGDVTSQRDVEQTISAALSEFGALDLLLNNAGINISGSVLDLDIASWEEVIAVNLTGIFRFSQVAARAMISSGGGTIINVSSQMAEVTRPGRSAYCCSKAGVRMLTKSLAVDLGQYGIRVNALAPGPIEVERTMPMLYGSEDHDSYQSRMLLGRFGQPEELVASAIFLASDASSFMTGSTLLVDGGYLTT